MTREVQDEEKDNVHNDRGGVIGIEWLQHGFRKAAERAIRQADSERCRGQIDDSRRGDGPGARTRRRYGDGRYKLAPGAGEKTSVDPRASGIWRIDDV